MSAGTAVCPSRAPARRWHDDGGAAARALLVSATLGLVAGLVAWTGIVSGVGGNPRVERVATREGLALAVVVPLAGILAGAALGLFRAPRRWPGEGRLLAPIVLLASLGQALVLRLGPDLTARGGLEDPLGYAQRQAAYTLLGLTTLVVAARWGWPHPIRRLLRLPWTVVLSSAAVVALTALFGKAINGRRLWIDLGIVTIQTVEPVKVALVFVLAAIFADRGPSLAAAGPRGLRLPPWRHAGPLLVALAAALLPLFFQGDLGPTLLLLALALVMFHAAGGGAGALGAAGLLALAGAAAAYLLGWPSLVRTRVDMWLDPFSSSEAVSRALWAASSGGFPGVGLGQGRPADIPVVASDFSFAAILEELGFLGGLAVLAAYGSLLALGIHTARRLARADLQLLALGLVALLTLQAVLIVGGNVALLPLTGITLPFVSFGGSALIVQLGIGGLLMALSTVAPEGVRDRPRMGVPRRRLAGAAALLALALAACGAAAFHRSVWGAARLVHTPFHDRAFLARAQQLVDGGALVVRGEEARPLDARLKELNVGPRTRARLAETAPYFAVRDGRVSVPETVARVTNPRLSDGLLGPDVGRILDRQGRVLARTLTAREGGDRLYPYGAASFPVVGLRSRTFGLRGLEAAADAHLRGRAAPSVARFFRDLVRRGDPGDDVICTIDAPLQRLAYDALAGHEGAVVALEVGTGEVLALASRPSIDPMTATGRTWARAARAGQRGPLVDRATQRTYPPGSTFKVVLDALWREAHPDDLFAYACTGRHPRTKVRELGRAAHGAHVDLDRALAVSCNVYFSELALRMGEELDTGATRFGFNEPLEIAAGDGSLPAVRSHALRTWGEDGAWQTLPASWYRAHPGALGQAAVGQNLVDATPIQMALVASIVANGGVLQPPVLVRETWRRDSDPESGRPIDSTARPSWFNRYPANRPSSRRVIDREAAEAVAADMRAVVTEGTARALARQPIAMAGKTGTAQAGDVDGDGREEASHAWFIGFAPAEHPRVAVAVLVEHGGNGSEVAAPIAAKVLASAVKALGDER